MKAFVASIVIVAAIVGLADNQTLVYYSTLDSLSAITNPKVGPAGTVQTGVTYVTGKVGNAIQIPVGSDGVTSSLIKGSLGDEGTIEMWAKVINNRESFGTSGDPVFWRMGNNDAFLHIGNNDGSGHSGILSKTISGGWLYTSATWGSGTYAGLFTNGDAKGWHHYAVVWRKSGIEGIDGACALYVDGALRAKTGWTSDSIVNSWASNGIKIKIGDSASVSSCAIDEFKIWNIAKTTFDLNPTATPTLSAITAAQHYPWCGKIDIGYTVSGPTDGLVVKITVTDNDNIVTYEAKTFNITPTATAGAHTVVWDATKDGVTKMSKNMVATVSLVVPEN